MEVCSYWHYAILTIQESMRYEKWHLFYTIQYIYEKWHLFYAIQYFYSGGLSVAVPSEVKGLLTVWKKFGKLKWAELVQPSIDIARDGFPLKDFELEDLERTDKNIRYF